MEKWKSKLKVRTGMSTYFPCFQLAALIVMLGFRDVVAQEAAPFEVPKGIVRQLVMSGVDPESIDLQHDGTARGLSGAVVDLNGDKQPEVVVSGKYGIGGICGNANCQHWVFRQTTNGFALLLNAGSVQQLDAQASVANGYRDVLTTRHDSAFEYTIVRYRFDGKRYRRQECFERRYDSTDNSRSAVRKPVTARVRC